MQFLKSPGAMFRGWHFLITQDPDAGLSSGALRAPEPKTASRTPARSARRLGRNMFFCLVKDFLSLGSQILVIFFPFRAISGAAFSYLVFSYRVFWVYLAPVAEV